jgi:hypothetical protein
MAAVRTSTGDRAATPVAVATPGMLTSAQFQQLAAVPPALTWFANIANPETRRALFAVRLSV